jgi:pyruvate/2-oxoacid:ferredoxin oxidoreductase alpha subunit
LLEWFVHSTSALMFVPQRRRLKIAVPIAFLATLVIWGTVAGCAHREYFPGTTIVRTDENRKIIETVEKYRQRLLTRNTVGLLALASQKYFEDSGTPRSDDDYGYDGLKQVLEVRLQRVKSLRYEIEYRNIRVTGDQAEVEVFLDGSFELAAAEAGDRYRRVNDYHRFLLEKESDEWKFLAGM